MSGKKNSSLPTLVQEAVIAPSFRPGQVQKSAPCQGGCPNCGDIRGWIGLVAQREKLGLSREEAYAQAWRTIADVNPFPATLGRICPHPCETHCNRAEKDEALSINAMERFLGDFAIRSGLALEGQERKADGPWIGVVGAGPSGLSFAYQMARRGYRVTVYDAREQPGGMLRYGVPDYRLPQDVLDAEIERILDLGVELQMGIRIGHDIALTELQARHETLYLAIGAQRGQTLDIPGADGPGVLAATEYLDAVNRGEPPGIGQRVLVVGGGNSAVDAARCARRQGAEVTLLYRRTRSEMPASEHEISDALDEGVELMELAAPASIGRDPDGRLASVIIQFMQLGEPDNSGRRRPVPVQGSTTNLSADTLIMAISQAPALEGLESLRHLGNWLLADADGSAGDGLLAGGDALGLGIAGNAIVQGRRAAEALHRRLSGDGKASERAPDIGPERIRFDSRDSTAAARKPHLPAERRIQLGMAEVAGNITEDEFLTEAQRCYSCGSCFGCEQCFMYCTKGCFTRLEEPRPGMYFTLNLDECQSCGKCVEVCPCGFLEITNP